MYKIIGLYTVVLVILCCTSSFAQSPKTQPATITSKVEVKKQKPNTTTSQVEEEVGVFVFGDIIPFPFQFWQVGKEEAPTAPLATEEIKIAEAGELAINSAQPARKPMPVVEKDQQIEVSMDTKADDTGEMDLELNETK